MERMWNLTFCIVAIFGLLKTIETAWIMSQVLSFRWFDWINFTRFSGFTIATHHMNCDQPFFKSLLWNVFLLLLFLLQHTVMAGDWWKTILRNYGFNAVERSFYVIASCFVMSLVVDNSVALPLPALWQIDIDTTSRFLLAIFIKFLHVVLWSIVFLATLGTQFTEFVGIKQVFDHCWPENIQAERTRRSNEVREHMRHSGIVAFLAILWIYPTMTLERLVISLVFTFYALLGHRGRAADFYHIKEH